MDNENSRGLTARLQNGSEMKTLLPDLRKHLWTILALSLSAALLMYIYAGTVFQPQYSVSATYVVTNRGVDSNLVTNLTSAQETANILSQIITGKPLMDAVKNDLGVNDIEGSISCEIVEETNLLMLRVTSVSPRKAFLILESIMENYPVVTDLMNKDVVMRVLIPPEVPVSPDARNNPLPRAVTTLLICACILTVLFALLSLMKDTIRTTADVGSKLDEKCLGAIAHEEKYKTLRMRLQGGQVPMLIDSPACSFRYIESVQKVCRAVQSQMENKGIQTLLVMSVEENEGKSTVAANLALGLAQRGKNVLLMDLDLRNPSLYKVFDFPEDSMTALGDVLSGKTPAQPLIGQMEDDRLFYCFNTRTYSSSTEILTNGRLEQLLSLLRERFEYIVIDSPPMSLTADAESLADVADAFTLVIREHGVWATQIKDMLDVLQGCRAESIGCILNDVHTSLGSGGGYGYGADYEGGYGYGRYYGRYYGNYGKKSEHRGKG